MSADRPTPTPPPTPEEARLRDALDRVATARPVAEGWDAIVERLTAEADGTTVLRPLPAGSPDAGADRGRTTGRRLALIAACVAAVAALGAGVVALVGHDDEPAHVTVTPPPAETTGWYVPVDLPAGWVLDSVGTDFVDANEALTGTRCPCVQEVWTRTGSAVFHQTSAGEVDPADLAPGDPVDLGRDVVGHLTNGGTTVVWTRAGRVHVVTVHTPGLEGGNGDADPADAIAAARGLVATSTDPEPEPGGGLGLAVRTSIPDIRSYRTVVVTLREDRTGRLASYGVSPARFDVAAAFASLGAPDAVTLPGQPRTFDRFEVNPGAAAGDADRYLYLGRWPGAAVFVGRYLEPAPANPMHDEDLRTVAAALRPATAEEWKAFLNTATGQVDERARVSAITDLIQGN